MRYESLAVTPCLFPGFYFLECEEADGIADELETVTAEECRKVPLTSAPTPIACIMSNCVCILAKMSGLLAAAAAKAAPNSSKPASLDRHVLVAYRC